jgi:ribokinase
MLIVVGSIYLEQIFETKTFPSPGSNVQALDISAMTGGRAMAQSLAAARWETRTALVSKTAGDIHSQQIVTRIRRNGVMTSGIVESELPTGAIVKIRDSESNEAVIHFEGANREVSSEQVPEEILGPGNFVLMQAELSMDTNLEVMKKAKECGALTVFNLAGNAENVELEHFEYLDYLLAGVNEAGEFAGKAGIDNSDTRSLARALAGKVGAACILVTETGCIATMRGGPDYEVKITEALQERTGQSRFSADCFCGTFAASLHDEGNFYEALRRAVTASCLCNGDDPFECFPYRLQVEEMVAEVK